MTQPKKIALIGMFGGMWRELNPGCFMLCKIAVGELQKRLPGASIDIYSIDNHGEGNQILKEQICGLEIRFFSHQHQIDLLEGALTGYDALVFGGDIIWGGDDVVADNPIFFLDSPVFLETVRPIVLFNCVHTFYDDAAIVSHRDKFAHAVARSSYAAVRTQAIHSRLARLDIATEFVPDPVLFAPSPTRRVSTSLDRRPSLGISIRRTLSQDLIAFLRQTALERWFDITIFPFSRQYDNSYTVDAVKAAFGERFKYEDVYRDPVDAFEMAGSFDYLINDTYHGIIAAIVAGKAFLSLDVETEATSRKQQLLEALGIDQQWNVRFVKGESRENVFKLTRAVEPLLGGLRPNAPGLCAARLRISKHFDCMARVIAAEEVDSGKYNRAIACEPKSSGTTSSPGRDPGDRKSTCKGCDVATTSFRGEAAMLRLAYEQGVD